MALALVSARYPQPSRMVRMSGLGRGICAERSCMGCEKRVQMNSPDYPDGILLEHWVSRDDRPVFLHALRNQHAIERVAMMRGKTIESEQMVNADGEALDAILRQFAEHVRAARPGESQLARLYLDKKMSDACTAE